MQEEAGFASASGFAPQKPLPQRRACLHLTPKTFSPGSLAPVPAQHGALRPGGQVNDPARKKEEAVGGGRLASRVEGRKKR